LILQRENGFILALLQNYLIKIKNNGETTMKKVTGILSLTTLILITLTSLTFALPDVVVESFEYDEADSTLGGLGDASGGWGGSWEAVDQGVVNVVAGNMDFDWPGIIPVGNHIEATDGGHIYRSLADTWPDDESTYWISLLYLRTDGFDVDDSYNGFSLFKDAQELLYIGKPWGTKNLGLDGTGVENAPSEIDAYIGGWLVVKLVMSGDAENDDAYLWINPDPSVEPDTTTANVHVGWKGSDGFNRFRIASGNAPEPAECAIDEIHVSQTFAGLTVTPVGLPDITDLNLFFFKGSNDHLPWDGASSDGSPDGERLQFLFDNTNSTKYLVGAEVSWIDVYTNRLSNVTEYTITSANDSPERDPKAWDFQGWDVDAGAWVTLHSIVDNPMWSYLLSPKTWTFENSAWYSSYRLNITAINGDADGLMQISEFEINGALGDTVEVVVPEAVFGDITDPFEDMFIEGSNENEDWTGPESDGSPDGEQLEMLFDNDVTTKYLVGAEISWLGVYTDKLSNVIGYTLTSANDSPDRDPRTWDFQGWDVGADAWVTLHSVVDNPSWPDFFTPQTWAFTNSGWYSSYRLKIKAINEDHQGLMQISEFDIFGLIGETVEIVVPPWGTAVETNAAVIQSYKLDQNYPNPFNPSTHINFSIPENTDVTLSVYNMLGQRVKTLVDQPMNAGIHNVAWNGTNEIGETVANGIYFYRLQSDLGAKTMKMMFMK
jgi:hypothetical protein